MRYIENYELREWVKDSLKKTIFQKAHALSIQTGCSILVKLQDVSAPTTNQYYATGPLQKAYNNHQFRKQPGEKCVSGETGLPLMDQAVQIGASTTEDGSEEMPQLSAMEDSSDMPQLGAEGDSSEMPQIGDLLTEQSFVDESKSESTMVQVSQDMAVPMHLAAATDSTHLDTTTTVTQTTQFEPQESNGAATDGVHVKVEPSDVIEVDTGQEMEPKIEETESDFLMSQQHGSIQMFNQPPTQRTVSHYQVPISPKPYQCGVCHKAFRSVQVLQKHTQTFHSRPQKLVPKRGRGRGSHYLNRPLHHQAPPRTSTYQTFQGASGNTIQQTPPKPDFPEVQDLPGTSSQQIVQMSQIPSFTQPQSTPVQVAVSTADFTQSPSMFQTPGPSTSSTPAQLGQSTGRPIIDHQHTTRSRSYFNPRNNPDKPPSGLTAREIQQQILKTAGPVVTNRSFMNNAPKNNLLRKVNHTEFIHAISTMSDYGVVHELQIAGAYGKTSVFIKKPPNELTNFDLCPILKYQERYNRPSPTAIGPALRRQLLSLGLATETQLKGTVPRRRAATLQNF